MLTTIFNAGEPIEDALTKKFGPNARALMQRVIDAGQEDGARFAAWKVRLGRAGWVVRPSAVN